MLNLWLPGPGGICGRDRPGDNSVSFVCFLGPTESTTAASLTVEGLCLRDFVLAHDAISGPGLFRLPVLHHRGWQPFSAKGQMVTLLGLVSYTASSTTIQLCPCSVKTAVAICQQWV